MPDEDVTTNPDQNQTDPNDTSQQPQQQQQQQQQTQTPDQGHIFKRIREDERKRYEPYRDAIAAMAEMAGFASEQELLERIKLAKQQAATQPQTQKQDDTTGYLAKAAYRTATEVQQELEYERLKTNPMYEGIGEVRDQLIAHVKQTGQSIKDAYWQLYGESAVERATKTTEQRVLESVKNRSGLGAERDLGTPELKSLGLSESELAFAVGSGMDPKEYAAMKDISTLDQYQKARKK